MHTQLSVCLVYHTAPNGAILRRNRWHHMSMIIMLGEKSHSRPRPGCAVPPVSCHKVPHRCMVVRWRMHYTLAHTDAQLRWNLDRLCVCECVSFFFRCLVSVSCRDIRTALASSTHTHTLWTVDPTTHRGEINNLKQKRNALESSDVQWNKAKKKKQKGTETRAPS